MFLSLTWAIISDIDINSEVIRCIGSARFTLWAIYRAAFERTYEGNLKLFGMEIDGKNYDKSKIYEDCSIDS